MMKRLSSFVLLIMIALPFYVQAADIKAPGPIYQVDMTHSVIADVGSGSGDIVASAQPDAMASVDRLSNYNDSTETMKSTERLQGVANILLEPANVIAKVSQYSPHKSIAATGILGVPRGGYIGIGKPIS